MTVTFAVTVKVTGPETVMDTVTHMCNVLQLVLSYKGHANKIINKLSYLAELIIKIEKNLFLFP